MVLEKNINYQINNTSISLTKLSICKTFLFYTDLVSSYLFHIDNLCQIGPKPLKTIVY